MKVLIINLDREKRRWEFQRQQMESLGLDYERISAFSIKDIDQQELAERALEWERPMRDVEVACLYSHRKAWQMITDRGESALVLEDDALLSSSVPGILSALSQKRLDHVTLEARSRKKLLDSQSEVLTNSSKITRLYQDRTGAAAYVLSPQGAEILLNSANQRAGLADAIIAAAYNMKSWQVEPAPAIQLDQCEQYGVENPLDTRSSISSIEHVKPAPAGPMENVKFKLRRIRAQLRMGLRQLTKLGRSQRRYVAVEINR